MRFTKEMKKQRKDHLGNMRMLARISHIQDIVDFVTSDSIFLKHSKTFIQFIEQVDRITKGEPFDVKWYALSGNTLQIYIRFANINISFYCTEILRVLEDFLQVKCTLTEDIITIPSRTKTSKSINCIREG